MPPVEELIHGITAVRNPVSRRCGSTRASAGRPQPLALYRKRFVRTTQTYADEPVKFDGHSEAADALRQFAQVFKTQSNRPRRAATRRRRGAPS